MTAIVNKSNAGFRFAPIRKPTTVTATILRSHETRVCQFLVSLGGFISLASVDLYGLIIFHAKREKTFSRSFWRYAKEHHERERKQNNDDKKHEAAQPRFLAGPVEFNVTWFIRILHCNF